MNFKKRAWLVAGGMIMAAASPAYGQDDRLIENVTSQDIVTLAEELGGSGSITEDSEGAPRVIITFDSGYKARADFVCGALGCTGINLVASFGLPDGYTRADALDLTDRFDWDRTAVSAGTDKEGDLYIARYVITDGGVTWENLKVNLMVFESLTEQFADYE